MRFHRRVLQIPPDRYRCHYVKVTVTVLYPPDWIAIRHGPRELARYDATGKLLPEARKAPARARWERLGARSTSGQFICYRTGHFYLLLTGFQEVEILVPQAYTFYQRGKQMG